MPDDVLGPNTAVPSRFLKNDVILCAGEDREEFLAAMAQNDMASPLSHHRYRCYEFWRFQSVLAVLSGIGTGSLEPLLWELFQPDVVKRILLVGTAGLLPRTSIPYGIPFIISQAWPAGTGIDALAQKLPLAPRWTLMPAIPTATSVSTDFYYGFSPGLNAGAYPFPARSLQDHYTHHMNMGTQLVEMEVAQFYFFCQHLARDTVQYAAIKSPVNMAGEAADQLKHSPLALIAVVDAALKMLHIPTP